ncbi:MAG: tRNA (adenosine(37)-N6)-threonylcarbamoyltransferase complex dimerization subunit type 1 TsaB [bacterium]|nr:tRNA (adenosine(37)-N6)-threonylcarbamoyltransferase complex dimerization subunit type 1 TsaB [bacterium]
MNTLVLDTACKIELVALGTEEKLYHITENVNFSHSVTIFNNIENLLKQSGLAINDINLIGVGIGPGSFTGIRIALSTVRMLAQVIECPLVGIKTHMLYAASVNAAPDDYILVAFDAKKQRVFGALYQKQTGSNSLVEVIEPGDYSMEFLLSEINQEYTTFSIGDGAQKYLEEINQKISGHEYLENFFPSPGTACELINQLYTTNPEQYRDFNNVVPFYARKSDAEILKEAKKK